MLKPMSASPSPRAARRFAVAAAMLALPLVAACGSTAKSSAGATVPANPSVTIDGTDNKFDAKAYTATAGDVSFAYYNKGNVSHSLVIKASDGTKLGTRIFLSPGKSAGESVKLAAGTYEVYCDVPGHKESGMDATLTVN